MVVLLKRVYVIIMNRVKIEITLLINKLIKWFINYGVKTPFYFLRFVYRFDLWRRRKEFFSNGNRMSIFFFGFLVNKINPDMSVNPDPLLQYFFAMSLFGLSILFSVFRMMTEILCLYLIKEYNVDEKYPKYAKYIKYYAKVTMGGLIFEFIVLIILITLLTVMNIFLYFYAYGLK